MNDWDLIGHDWAVRRLQTSLISGAIGQSHLFVGPESVGKTSLALALARSLLVRGAADPQRAARLVAERKHADVSFLEPEEGVIKVDPLRDLLHVLGMAPVEGERRVAIVVRADLMHDAAKNAILKTLEEPNPRVVIMLTAPSPEHVISTIVSRCQVLALHPVAQLAIKEALIARGADEARAAALARAARGRPGWALRAQSDPAMLDTRQRHAEALRAVLAQTRTDRLAAAERMAKLEADELDACLDDWMYDWREAARSGAWPVHHAHAALRAVHATRARIARKVNVRLALDVLMLDLPRA